MTPILRQNVKQEHKKERLLYYHEIPRWQQDNRHIRSCYRHTSASIWTSLASIRYLHNQSINFATHALGAAAFLSFFYSFYNNEFTGHEERQLEDLVPILIYCSGVVICFSFSAVFHLLCNHSHAICELCNKLDYLGIVALMWGACISTIHFSFPFDPSLRIIHWVATTIFASSCMKIILTSDFSSPQLRIWRTAVFGAFGSSSLLSIVHAFVLSGIETQRGRISLPHLIWMAVVNVIGAFVYATKIPERWVPHTFDVFGSSHQIFHVAVILAAWIHLSGLIYAFHAKNLQPCQKAAS